MVTLADIEEARERIAPYIRMTPVLSASRLDAQSQGRFSFKCENLQVSGSFKARGAHNAVFSLPDEVAARGVVTHSSGNHAAALALAARQRGIPATVVMPVNAAASKRANVIAEGAVVIDCEASMAAREATAARVLAETGGTLVHPYDDCRVVAGQGTAAFELLEQCPDLDVVCTPVGGGGLLAGTAVAVKSLRPGIRVVGVEPALADDAWRSFHGTKRVTLDSSATIADGLRGSIGERNLALLRRCVDDIVTVSEASIAAATRLLWEQLKVVVEPSSAVPFAAFLEGRLSAQGQHVGIILSGGNVDLDALPWGRQAADSGS